MAYGYYSDPGTSFGNTGQTNTQETFIQRQKRLQASSQPASQPSTSGGFQPVAGSRAGQNTAPQPATGSTGTPVTGNGGIPPPTPAAPPAPAPQQAPPQSSTPAPAPAPAPAPLSLADREKAVGIEDRGNNLVYVASYGGMVDRNHPIYLEAMKKAPTTAAAPTATGAPTTGTPGSALGGPAEAAKSGMFTQAAPPEHDFQNWQQLELVSNMLANPHTLTPQVIEQMKQKSMEEALLGNQQAQQQAAEEAAASGFSLNGGRAAAQQRASNDMMMNAILGQNRDLEVQASQQNRQDEINAAQLSEAILGGQVGRGSQVYGDILAGQNANRGDYWTGKAQELQKYGIDQGVAVDTSRIASGDRQFNARLGEDARQSNNQMGFNWAQLSADQQAKMMQLIMGTAR